MYDLKTVVPEAEWEPQREYRRNGAVITCHRIIDAKVSVIRSEYKYDERVLFTLVLSSEEYAKALMNDLYYGEYTGS